MPNLHEVTSFSAAELHGLAAYPAALRVDQQQKEMTIQDLFALLVRRRVLIAVVASVVIAAAAIKYANTTRMYKSSATIQVQKDSMDALSLNEMIGTNAPPTDALESNITLQTQAQILQSET